ncbi:MULTISPECIES: ABC transporter ATP-binding protein [unclassified Halomonas]|uniref:ABC transporter ATP-binding protein n=1 Tax=unclassified Halomonas TaxID=2609666 RepID=UPI00209DB6B4|nr:MULTISPECIES: ABC transporter ATP-binding protein [unclassified Halomonas]MCP1314106.1 ABC transporter ATP-binding protein [Halomonas sp. 707D7]MCP1325143.1 ABC transporter ATP-binding protein [Halomonas sp. 707D4]
MCSDVTATRHDDTAIALTNVSKTFYRYERPLDRLLLQFKALSARARFDTISGLKPMDLTIRRGEVVGLVGRNGAGKSTLLQLVCNTLSPSTGTVTVNGKIAALLELGSGFNPEFTGRENVFMSAAIAGLSRRQVQEKFDEIHAFSGIGDFIDQPVKTYSSGMYVRLAFAVATSVEPDILVVDEALSVGDGAFARKSFDRIMALRDSGATILFCSHSLYQVENLCDRALWVEGGEILADDSPSIVIPRYEQFLLGETEHGHGVRESAAEEQRRATPQGSARLLSTQVLIDGKTPDARYPAVSGESTLEIEIRFASDPALPCPGVAVTVSTPAGQIVTSTGSWEEGVTISRSDTGEGRLSVRFPALALLKGEYHVGAYLFCERGLHSYEWVDPISGFHVTQASVARGVVRLPHQWQPLSPEGEADV